MPETAADPAADAATPALPSSTASFADGDRVVALVGPTASGKSDIAVAVARAAGAEIVAVDAFTVYRGMDVGTAKPTAAQRRRVPHHLIDVLDPWQPCSVEWFQRAARTAVDEVRSRGRLPLLVGGSGLYYRAVVDPLAFPPTDPTVRQRIERRFAGDAAAAHAALADTDPDAAAAMDPANLRRAVRALEVIEVTGRRFSDWRAAWDAFDSVYPGLRVVALDVPRPELTRAIDRRVEVMFDGGLLDECRRLAHRGLSATARQAIGYAEGFSHLDGSLSLPQAIEACRVRTRRYAARQTRWFRADPRIQWVAPAAAVDTLRSACDS